MEAYCMETQQLKRIEAKAFRSKECKAWQGGRYYRENKPERLAYAKAYHEGRKDDGAYLAKRSAYRKRRRQSTSSRDTAFGNLRANPHT